MSSCLGVLLELHIPDLLAKESKPIALKDVSAAHLLNGKLLMSTACTNFRKSRSTWLSMKHEVLLLCSWQRRQV